MFYNRIGSDLQIEWPVTVDGYDDISSLDISVYVVCNRYRKKMRFTVEDNTIIFTFYGIDQRVRGVYDLELVLNEDDHGQVICDNKGAFELYGEIYEDYMDIYVTKPELSSCAYITINDVPEVDLSSYVTYSYLNSKHYLDAIPSEYITSDELDQALVSYITQAELSANSYLTQHQSLDAYVTKVQLNAAGYISSIPAEYITSDELNQALVSYITQAELSAYATKSYVADYVASYAPQVDLSAYVTKNQLNAAGYISSIPTEYITETELSSMSYATKSYVADYVSTHTGSVDLSAYVTKVELNNAGYISSIPSEYITSDELDQALVSYITETELSSMSYATQSYVQNKNDMLIWQGTYTQYQDLSTAMKNAYKLYLIQQ